jgi:hypothetical protein
MEGAPTPDNAAAPSLFHDWTPPRKTPVLPVIVGVFTMLHAAFFGSFLLLIILALTGSDKPLGSEKGVLLFFASAGALVCLIQLICGTGIILQKAWAKSIIRRFTLAVVALAGLTWLRASFSAVTAVDSLVFVSAIWPVLLYFLIEWRLLSRHLSK